MLKDFEIACEEKEDQERPPPRFYLSDKTPHRRNHPTLYVDPQDGGESICLLVIDQEDDGEIWLWRNGDWGDGHEDCDRLRAIGLTLDGNKIAVS